MTKKIFAFLILFVMATLIPRSANAVGDLTITPWRIVFGPHDRSAVVQLLNTSDTPNNYRMGWMITKATATGKYEETSYHADKDKDPNSVPHMVIYSPRQVTIEPHGEQVVRLSLRRPEALPPGEYRAHITFVKVADKKPPPAQDPNAKTVSMELNVSYGFSIPVIVRQGEDKDLKVSIQSPKLEGLKEGPVMKVDLHRDAGKFSSYGEVDVYWKPPYGDEIKMGYLNNIALYPEVQTRHLMVPLLKNVDIKGGTLRVVYNGKLESEGTKWAEATFPVGGK